MWQQYSCMPLLSNKARRGIYWQCCFPMKYTLMTIIIIEDEHLLCHLSETIITVLNPCIYCIKCSDNDQLDANET